MLWSYLKSKAEHTELNMETEGLITLEEPRQKGWVNFVAVPFLVRPAVTHLSLG